MARIAQELGPLSTELGGTRDNRAVVKFTPTAAASERRSHDAFTQRPVFERRIGWLASRIGQTQQVLAPVAASFRGGGGGNRCLAQAGKFFARIDENRRGIGFLQKVLLELRRERRELGIHRLEGVLFGR